MDEHRQSVVMTPSLAKAILNASPQLARPVDTRQVANLAARMRHPDSEDRASTYRVSLDINGHLVSGRHELLGVIQSDRAVPMTLITGHEQGPFVAYPPFDVHAAGLR